MALDIVWRNPVLQADRKHRIEKVVRDEYGTVYTIHRSNEARVFELLPGKAA